MKRILLIALLSLVFTGNSWAGGKDAFIRECGSCHKSGGKASAVNPGDKAARVWKKYFKRKRHPVDISHISTEDINSIIEFLQAHAADSDQPESAVIPK